jgi:hypothetical protein
MDDYPPVMPRRLLPLLTVLVAVLVAGCMGEPQQEVAVEESAAASDPPPPASEPSAGPTPAETPELGPLDFSVPAVGGGQINGADLAGRDVLLWFWAPW